MPRTDRRREASIDLVDAMHEINKGPASTPAKLNTEFFTALTKLMSTLTGNTSVVSNSDCTEFMLVYYAPNE